MYVAMLYLHDLHHVKLLNPGGSLKMEATAFSIRWGGYHVFPKCIFPVSFVSGFGRGL